MGTASRKNARSRRAVAPDQDTRYCQACGAAFDFGDDERKFYAGRGYKEPDFCLDCRERRRTERNADLIRVHAEQSGRSGWTEMLGHYGGGQTVQRNESGRRAATYPATCAACGKETMVPFVPRHGRPVYCPSCYGSRRTRRVGGARK